MTNAAILMLWTKYKFNGTRLGGNRDHEQEYYFRSSDEALAFVAGAQQDEIFAAKHAAERRAFAFGARERSMWTDAVLVDQDPLWEAPSGIRQAVGPAEWARLIAADDPIENEVWSDARAAWCVQRASAPRGSLQRLRTGKSGLGDRGCSIRSRRAVLTLQA